MPCFFLIIMDRVDKIFLSVLFALLGLGTILFYSGREFQRSSMRIVRFRKSYDYSEGLVKQYDFFDSFLQTGSTAHFLHLGKFWLF